MRLILVTPPAVEPVTLDEMKDYLRVDFNDDDRTIQDCIIAARQKLDGRKGLLGRCLITQEWRATLDGFPRAIELPLSPVSAVSAITYSDAAGDEQTLAPDTYMVAGLHDAGLVVISPARGRSWPFAPYTPSIVSVTFTAGYGDAPENVPEPIRQAIKIYAASLYENREAIPSGTPPGWLDLINDYRVQAF